MPQCRERVTCVITRLALPAAPRRWARTLKRSRPSAAPSSPTGVLLGPRDYATHVPRIITKVAVSPVCGGGFATTPRRPMSFAFLSRMAR